MPAVQTHWQFLDDENQNLSLFSRCTWLRLYFTYIVSEIKLRYVFPNGFSKNRRLPIGGLRKHVN